MVTGTDVVNPPDEVLLKGNEKFQFNIVGVFTKGVAPFKTITKFAHRAWKKTLVNVFQKETNVFVFKFVSAATMNAALSRGTCSKFGDPLPNVIKATATDPVSGDKYIVEVNVSYFNKPLICEGCKSLGHTVAACQKVKHIWVVKQRNDSDIDSGDGGVVNGEGNSEKVSAEPIPNTVNDCETSIPDNVCATPLPNNDGWIPASKTFSPIFVAVSDISLSPLNNFRSLRRVDEIDAKRAFNDVSNYEKLSNSQKKKLEKALAAGKLSPQLP
ncbi:hypothetical protein POM88_047651 [Heracleum sosnowskyi]|uniref:DUF4283 domain-containing protein n=1 Tax=Heracleum sosnowskyi TaxID=360622 RepID=A0AAD8GSG4_9APIA|nr:hypothetical protein POM88_047651 [Heracleum sosnowskyi]